MGMEQVTAMFAKKGSGTTAYAVLLRWENQQIPSKNITAGPLRIPCFV